MASVAREIPIIIVEWANGRLGGAILVCVSVSNRQISGTGRVSEPRWTDRMEDGRGNAVYRPDRAEWSERGGIAVQKTIYRKPVRQGKGWRKRFVQRTKKKQ